jgi:hypothetical protein
LEQENQRRKKENADTLVASGAAALTREDDGVTSGLPEFEIFSKDPI